MTPHPSDGGPAYPSVWNGDEPQAQHGITLRDYFAAHAVAGELAQQGTPDGVVYGGKDGPARLAKWAYLLADALLAERAKPTPGA